mmetsp:Transcript_3737/g.3893  ORF Transcript_3737/g.3893 Transcript_3737/m.3893 type:complete len:289 (+) Transcript_3737:80-946(+)
MKTLFCFITFFHAVNSTRVYYTYENSIFTEKTYDVGAINFRKHKSPQKFVTNSQSGQDKFVYLLLNNLTNGYFIDLAANHWKKLSNTNSLEVFYNWTGICIEPNPRYQIGLLANRDCHLFINPVSDKNDDVIQFHMAGVYGGVVHEDQDNAGKTEKNVNLTTVSLISLLQFFKAPTIIDYMSLDVEGGEWDALKNFDFSLYRFKVLSIERPIKRLQFLLFRHGYRFLYMIAKFGDCIFIHISHPDFLNVTKKFHAISKKKWQEKGTNGRIYKILQQTRRENISLMAPT